MHEMSIATNIFSIVREKMEEIYGKILPVKKVKIVVGKMSTVVPTALDFALEVVSRDTVFEKAEFDIEYVPLKIRCKDCEAEMILEEPFLFCRKCDSFNVEVITGKELYVDSFELEAEPDNISVS